jgi:hypothetical protein
MLRGTDAGRGIAPDRIEPTVPPFVQVDARLTRTQSRARNHAAPRRVRRTARSSRAGRGRRPRLATR